MYSNWTKSQAFMLAKNVTYRCPKPLQTLKTQSLSIGSYQNLSLKDFKPHSVKPTNFSVEFQHRTSGIGKVSLRSIASGLRFRSVKRNFSLIKVRSLSSSYSRKVDGGGSTLGVGKTLPWLANREKEAKGLEDAKNRKASRSPWEESANRVIKVSGNSKRKPAAKLGKASSKSSWEESAQKLEKTTNSENEEYSWEAPSAPFPKKIGISSVASRELKNGMKSMTEEETGSYDRGGRRFEEKYEEEGEEEMEAVVDPRWDNIKSRFKGMVDPKVGWEKPEFWRWNKQENWVRKTWKEATESTAPKMVGEGIYGVGPVLAALSAGTREFYALYVQEGLDLSSNNRKKKDKKGFEKVLKIAESVGLSIKQASKHDLNMIVDNRPHQGLVLDASPLEMVKIQELDPVSSEEGKGSLWVALDEVTDPQNLGAIIRSAYFFGASGVVLCAKNSAPLSGVVSKASAGSLELMELRYCKNMMQFLVSSAENGWRVLGGSISSKSIPVNEVLPGSPTILVLGSEGTGLRPLVERSCTQLIRIPGNMPVDVFTSGLDEETADINSGCSSKDFQSFLAVESLNVSVAAGVLLHHLIGNNYKNHHHTGDNQTNTMQ